MIKLIIEKKINYCIKSSKNIYYLDLYKKSKYND